MPAQIDATGQEYNDIAAYLATVFPVQGTQSIAHNTATGINITNVILNTNFGDYVGLRTTAGGQTRGAASFTVGSTLMTYTPTTGQCGADTINYEAYRTINSGTSNLRALSVSIANPAAPNITTSANSANGVIGSVFTYTPVSGGGTVGIYDISSGTLPAGLGLNTSTGAITGTPSGTAGISNVTLRGSNCLNGALSGQSSTRNIAVTINTSASVTLLASPSTASSGGSATLTWSSDGASCAASGAWSGIKASVGSQVLTNLSVTANYTITCSGASGSASQTVTIIVN